MDPELQQKIISRHGHLVSHSDSPSYISSPGTPSLETSGPPSPTSGEVINFAVVVPGIYRSSFPRKGNFEHLHSLGLKTILFGASLQSNELKLIEYRTLVGGEYPSENVEFMDDHGIKHLQIPIPAHKEPSVVIPLESIANALKVMLDPSNHPLLLHCNKGKVCTSKAAITLRVTNSVSSTALDVSWLVTERFMMAGISMLYSQSMYTRSRLRLSL